MVYALESECIIPTLSLQGLSLPTVDNLVLLSYLFEVTIDEILVVKAAREVQISA